MDEATSPVEAALAWLIPKTRRARGGFPGAEVIAAQLRGGVARRRVGLLSRGPPARGHAPILDPATGETVGEVTSGECHPVSRVTCHASRAGCPSPTLGGGTNVAMGYVRTALAKPGTPLLLGVRSRRVDTTVTKMPFVPSNYYHLK